MLTQLDGENYILAKLQENLDKTKEVIANICKLKNTQEKLLLQCILGRIQHLLAAVPIHLSRDFAKQHDEVISTAVAATLELGDLDERDKLLMQRKISNHRTWFAQHGEESRIPLSCWLHAVYQVNPTSVSTF